MSSSLEAKIVVLGAQGVGKTSLVMRYCKGTFDPAQTTSTVGASFLTKRVVDTDTDTVVRLQIWDTAGQERFRSISRLYYRGADACILCYSVTDARSFAEMGRWLAELRRYCGPPLPHHQAAANTITTGGTGETTAGGPGLGLGLGPVVHVVGTKADLAARDPAAREVPFERCIAYVAENLHPGRGSTPPPTAVASPAGGADGIFGRGGGGGGGGGGIGSALPTGAGQSAAAQQLFVLHNGPGGGGGGGWGGGGGAEPRSPSSKRSSGFWGQEAGWDACHEISAESGEGVDEVFRVVTRKLVEQNRRMQAALQAAAGSTPDGMYGGAGTPGGLSGSGGYGAGGADGAAGGYFDGANPRGSFRVGRDRRSWLFSPGFSPSIGIGGIAEGEAGDRDGGVGRDGRERRRCC